MKSKRKKRGKDVFENIVFILLIVFGRNEMFAYFATVLRTFVYVLGCRISCVFKSMLF